MRDIAGNRILFDMADQFKLEIALFVWIYEFVRFGCHNASRKISLVRWVTQLSGQLKKMETFTFEIIILQLSRPVKTKSVAWEWIYCATVSPTILSGDQSNRRSELQTLRRTSGTYQSSDIAATKTLLNATVTISSHSPRGPLPFEPHFFCCQSSIRSAHLPSGAGRTFQMMTSHSDKHFHNRCVVFHLCLFWVCFLVLLALFRLFDNNFFFIFSS